MHPSVRSGLPSLLVPVIASLGLGCTTTPIDDAGSESNASDTMADTATTGEGQTSGQTNGTDPTAGESGTPGCPPIDPAPCQECTCIDDGWICEPTCLPSCDGALCGASCELCPEGEPDCEPDQGVCTAEGQCVGTPPPELGFCEGALQPGFEDELDQVSGCSDVVVFARDATDERGLVLHVDQGLYAEAQATGMPVHAELPATDPTVYLEARTGFNVTIVECSDVIVKDPDIQETWRPQAGMVILDVTPFDEFSASATVQLVGVELRRDQPGPLPITVDLTWTDVIVGPVPG
jgi:hypothetical protein